MEALRTHLKIERWQVFGGSWGSTLALAYAETHPERVTELVLRGIFMLRRKELEFFYQYGSHFLAPDAWEPYEQHIPEAERHDMMAAYYKRLTSPDEAVRNAAAKVWSTWEAKTSYLVEDAELVKRASEDEWASAFARIECHFFNNRGFFASDAWLLENAHKLKNIPTVIVQGKYDLVCPMISAYDLSKVMPHAKLIVTLAGHSAWEDLNTSALVEACDDFAKK